MIARACSDGKRCDKIEEVEAFVADGNWLIMSEQGTYESSRQFTHDCLSIILSRERKSLSVIFDCERDRTMPIDTLGI